MNGISVVRELEQTFWVALEEVLGDEQAQKIGEHSSYLGNHPFSLEQITKIQNVLEELYGVAAGRGLTLRSGRAWVKYGLRFFYHELGWGKSEFRLLPRHARIQRGLESLASWMQPHFQERFEVERTATGWLWQISGCGLSACIPDKTMPSCCYWMVGVLEEVLKRLGDGKNFLVREVTCQLYGAPACLFEIPARPLGDWDA